ncbi:MAG TPA: ATP-dependent helicase HrpB [Acidobacteriota bacterium]|nr:ATP-dependent helicase HrpB [Acidobacteriota bacterium]
MLPLPIDSHIPEIITTLRRSNSLILTAPPGAGKTTRIPRSLLDAGFAQNGEILILEPRRLAARLAAARVSEELGEKLGKTVGYSIRFENVSGPATRIRFLTEAILTRRMVHAPNLDGISTVILDEFHERHLATDLAIAFLKQLQCRKRTLKLLIMSATMDVSALTAYLPDSQVLSVGESPFALKIDYEDKPDSRPLHEKVSSAVLRLLRAGLAGDILVFLPGAAEIRRSAEALQPIVDRFDLTLRLLHGDLPASEQRRAIEPASQAKVILATNVAETSITIPGIAAVIDSGLARVAGHSPWSGFPTLTTARISKSSADQRAGRAGRTQAGRVIRLYTKQDFLTRPEHDTPEIKRADLAETALLLHGAGIRDLGAFAWFDPPARSSIEAAESLLAKLGAITQEGCISDLGIQMLQLPVHPRLARLILEGKKWHSAETGTLLAALLSERDIRMDSRTRLTQPQARVQKHVSGQSDLLELIERYREAENAQFEPEKIFALDLDTRAVQAVRRSQRQLYRLLSAKKPLPASPSATPETDEGLMISVLAAFPDRIARRRKKGSRELLLAGGGSAILSPASIVQEPEFVVAVDAEEQKEKPGLNAIGPKIRLASAIELEWLAVLFPDSILQKTELVWNERAGRVEEVSRTSYQQISLEETVRPARPSHETARLFASAVLNQGTFPFHDASSLPAFQSRLSLISRCFPQENFPILSETAIRSAVEILCSGKRSLKELATLSIVSSLMEMLTERQRTLLRREAPERIPLKSGRNVRIHYESTETPWIESRLQDFFGTYETPAICAGRIPLTVHLLAPNGRAVQVTNDLSSFWKNHYPSIRRELQRRYPKHAWPEPESIKRRA